MNDVLIPDEIGVVKNTIMDNIKEHGIEDIEEIKETEENNIDDEDTNNLLEESKKLMEEMKEITDEINDTNEVLRKSVESLNYDGTGLSPDDMMGLISGQESYTGTVIKSLSTELGKYMNENYSLLPLLFTPAKEDTNLISEGIRVKYDGLDYILKDEYKQEEVKLRYTNDSVEGYGEEVFYGNKPNIIEKVLIENKDLFPSDKINMIIWEVAQALTELLKQTRQLFVEQKLKYSDYSIFTDLLNIDKVVDSVNKYIKENGKKRSNANNLIGFLRRKLKKKLMKTFGSDDKTTSKLVEDIVTHVNNLFKDTVVTKTILSELIEVITFEKRIYLFGFLFWCEFYSEYEYCKQRILDIEKAVNSLSKDEPNYDDDMLKYQQVTDYYTNYIENMGGESFILRSKMNDFVNAINNIE